MTAQDTSALMNDRHSHGENNKMGKTRKIIIYGILMRQTCEQIENRYILDRNPHTENICVTTMTWLEAGARRMTRGRSSRWRRTDSPPSRSRCPSAGPRTRTCTRHVSRVWPCSECCRVQYLENVPTNIHCRLQCAISARSLVEI